MQNRSVWFVWGSTRVSCLLGSTGHWPVVFGGSPNTCFPASHRKVHASRVRSPIRFVVLLIFVPFVCHAQEATPTPSPGGAEAESVVVSATRFDIPLDQSPATVTVISSEDIEQKQIQRVSDALREVPGLTVVQTGTAGQLTSVFMRGLPSQDMQVLLDGIPINQGLSGAMNFADITTDDIDRIEVVRGPQSALYGPHALAGVIQIFTKQGTGTPVAMVAGEGGSYDSFREWGQSDGKVGDFDYSVAGS